MMGLTAQEMERWRRSREPVPSYDDVAEILEAAADAIERDGWCQQTLLDSDGRHCLVGGVSWVTPGQETYRWAPWTALRMLSARIGYREPYEWNDEAGRTVQEVLDLLRATAKEARQVESDPLEEPFYAAWSELKGNEVMGSIWQAKQATTLGKLLEA